MPPPEYYEIFEKKLHEKFPGISPRVAEHICEVEWFLDLCIVSGFSLGAKKSKDKICTTILETLGSLLMREGHEALERHLEAVKD